MKKINDPLGEAFTKFLSDNGAKVIDVTPKKKPTVAKKESKSIQRKKLKTAEDDFYSHDLSVANENTIEENKDAGKKMLDTMFKSLGYYYKGGDSK